MLCNDVCVRTAILAASLAVLATGCDDGVGSSLEDRSNELTAIEGLDVDSYDAASIVGTYTRDGVSIAFTIDRDEAVRTATLADGEGRMLLESIAEPGHELVTLFDGRATLSGNPVQEAKVDGDPDAFESLLNSPEGQRIAELRGVLQDAGVDPVLLGSESLPTDDAPRLYNDGTYWNLGPLESVTVGTWGWLSYTHIAVRVGPTLNGPTVGYGCVEYRAGFAAPDYVCGWSGSEGIEAYQFWGALLTIRNYYDFVVMRVRTY